MRFKTRPHLPPALLRKVGVPRAIYKTWTSNYERPIDSWFPYKNRFARARDMPSPFTVLSAAAGLAVAFASVTFAAAAASAR
jgi:hypothetical protein